MAITITVLLPIKPDKSEEFKGILKMMTPDTRAYDGCQFIDIYEDQGQPGNFMIFERWESREKYEKYVAWRAESGMMDSMGDFIAVAPVTSYYEKVDA